MKKLFGLCFAFFLLCRLASAQDAWVPDPNLREAVREALGFQSGAHFLQDDLRKLDHLVIDKRGIENLKGIEHATNLTWISFSENNVTDLSPLTTLTKLDAIYAWGNRELSDLGPLASLTDLRILVLPVSNISDIRPLAGLTQLEELDLNYNSIENIDALAGLTQLTKLRINDNWVTDVRPLATLTLLKELKIQNNRIVDFSPLVGLAIPDLQYDEICEIPQCSVENRLTEKKYPAAFQIWFDVKNRPDLTFIERVGLHGVYVTHSAQFGLHWVKTDQGVKFIGDLKTAKEKRQTFNDANPNLILLAEIRMRDAFESAFYHEDWQYWIKDASGNRVIDPAYPAYFIDFTHPDVINLIVQQSVAIDKCGLFDGIFLDWWKESHEVLRNDFSKPGFRGNVAEQRARDEIIRRIRDAVSEDFIIMVNPNREKPLRAAPYINGLFMETLRDNNNRYVNGYTHKGLIEIESTLLWAEKNLRQPQLNCLEGWGLPTQSPDSPRNRQWMRVFTTMSLTHSDGYVLYSDGIAHDHYWYEFWDAKLGKPVGEKAELYQTPKGVVIDGLFIREFTNGWAVYNRSGKQHLIRLSEKVSAIASGVENKLWHTIVDLDGEIYLKPVEVQNPADVNKDSTVNVLDLIIIANALGKDSPDLNGDGTVNILDLIVIANAFEK